MAESQTSSSTLARRGLMFILSSPSGAGKTTISRMLLGADDEIKLSVSVTTRPPRPGEVDGVHYYFVDEGRIRNALKEGQDFLFDIDWQGTQQLFQKDQQDVVRVFILPPRIAELERRLRSRDTDSDEVIDARMERARAEISHWDAYDYVVINEDVDSCFDKVSEILDAERMKRQRQTGLIPFVRELMA